MIPILNKTTLENSYQYTLDVLKTVGVKFEKESARDFLISRGCTAQGNIVFFPHTILEEALGTLPKTEEISSQKRYVAATSPFGNAPMMLDYKTGAFHRGTVEDAICSYQLGETADIYECANPAVADPSGIDSNDAYVSQIAMLLKYSDKYPSVGIRATGTNAKDGDVYQSTKRGIRLIREVYDTWDKPVMTQGVCPMAPLSYDEEALNALDAIIEEEQNISIFPCSLSFMTGPETLLGQVIQDFALSLAGLVYIQLKKPGISVSLCECSSVTDMSTLQPAYACPENIQIQTAFYELCEFQKIPCTIAASLGDTTRINYQTGAESMLSTLLPYFTTNINTAWCYPGQMASYGCGCFQKVILDEETMAYVNRVLRGMNQTIDSSLKEKMINAHETNSYLTLGDSSLYRQEYYLPKIFTKQGMSNETKEIQSELDLRVEVALKNRYESYELPHRTDAQKKLLQEFLPTVCKY